ncbi:MAG: hypothetical protein LBH28_01155 [Oscillospiraceae bacterium]|nr:hypothetical protein [Oscillospiraceae bacterium]
MRSKPRFRLNGRGLPAKSGAAHAANIQVCPFGGGKAPRTSHIPTPEAKPIHISRSVYLSSIPGYCIFGFGGSGSKTPARASAAAARSGW